MRNYLMSLCCLLMALCASLTAYGQIVGVGSGSYTTAFPGTDAAGRNTFPAGAPQLSGTAATKPVPTNDWWSNMVKVDHGGQAFNYPLSFRSKAEGLVVNYTIPGGAGATEYREPMSAVDAIVVGVSNMAATRSTVSNHTDWTVTMNWNGGGRDFNALLGIGMPFTYFTKGASDVARVAVGFNPAGATVSGNKIIIRNNFNGANFVVFGPAGSTWSGSSGVFTSTLNGKNYWSMVMLPQGADVNAAMAALEPYAFAFPGNTTTTWNYNASNGIVRATFSVTPDVKEGTNNIVPMGLLPHHWSRLAGNSAQPNSYTYHTVRGQMKLLLANSFTTENRFSGILPTLPNLAKYSGGFDPGALYKKIDQMKGDQLPAWTDSYNEGQNMNRLIQAAHIAHQIGYTSARDQLLNTVKERLENWFTAQGGEVAFLFFYNNTWKTMIGYPAGHSQDSNLNDHHFHWGYFIHAAAAIEQYQPGWASQWGGMVDLLVRDAANPSRTDSMFPFMRNFSPYAGHAWANGFATEPFGNDQESTSESMQFNSSLIHWGTITNNPQIRDLGIFLYTTEQSAVEEYWFDINRRTFQPNYAHEMVARIWGAGYDNGTWWTSDIAASYGIQLYPIHGGALYMGHNTAYVQRVWDGMKSKTGVLSNTPNDNLWYDTYWSYLAFLDPQQAITLYNAYPERSVKVGMSDAQTYHWLHTMNAMGQVAEEITANHPIAAVFNKSGVKTYVAHNYSGSTITVTYSDGFSMTVPPRSMATNRDIAVSVSLTASASEVASNASVTLNATTTGSGISKVEFYRDGTLIGTDTSAPYTITTAPLAAGFPAFHARAYVGSNHNVSNIVTVQAGSQLPYGGTARQIPGTIEAGHYDVFEGGKGQGIAYSDATSWNEGNFRTNEAVDAGTTTTEGVTVGWIDAGEWLEYTVNVQQAGTYDVTLKYTSGNTSGGGPFWFERADGTKISPDITVAFNDTNWSTYVNKVVSNVTLGAGQQVIRVKVGNGGFNLGRMTFTYTGGGDTTPPTAPTNLTSPSKTTSSVALSWNTSTDQGGVTGYEVFVNSEATPRMTVTGTTANVTGLTASTSYNFRVRAKDAVPNYSAYSNTITVVTDGAGLPSPWATSNIGSVGVAGNASHSGSTFTVNGSGADIWGTADAFRYVYQPVSGDVTITARVASLGNTDPWAKAGVMIRESTAANARHVLTAVTIANGLAFQRRAAAGGESAHTAGPGGSVPYWVRVSRAGNVFTSFVSSNGTSWTQVGSVTIAMPAATQVGLAVTSHNNSVTTTATFDNVSVVTSNVVAVTGVSVSPTSASINVGATTQLTATVAPSNATNKNVTWSSSNSGIASVNASGLVTGVAAGNATITVTTQDGGRTASASITVNSVPTGQDITNLSGGVVSAQYDDSPAAERFPNLIDNSTSTKYLTFHNAGWVQFQAPSSYVVNRYTITSANDAPERDPLNWTLQGSNNGSTWTTIDTRNGVDFPSRFQTQSFTFSNATGYTHYRFNLTNNSSTILQLAEFELFGTPAQNNGGVCSGTASNGDYAYQVSSSGSTVNWTFIPQAPIAGSTMAIIYVKVGNGGFAGYNMNASGSNFVFSQSYSAGSSLTFYFTYRVGTTAAERNSSANPHTYVAGTSCTSGATAGGEMLILSENSDEDLVLYPNPVKDQLFIRVQREQGDMLKMFDGSGREIKMVMPDDQTVDVSAMPSGIYMIRLQRNERMLLKRFIKE